MQKIMALISRKFLLCVGCGGVCSILVWFDKISDSVFSVIIIGTVGAYITSNVILTGKGKDGATSE
jgi:hypothetical protein